MEMETEKGYEIDHSLDINYTSEYEKPYKSEAPENIIYPIVIALSVVFCLLLTVSILSQRVLRSPYFYVILSWALVNIMHVTIILSVEWMVIKRDTWTLGESGCEAVLYFQTVFMIVKAYHMPLAVVSSCLGRHQFDVWFKHRPLAAILAPVMACVCIWIIVLLSCIPFATNARHIEFHDIHGKRNACTSDVDHITVFFVLLFVHYLIPIVLTFSLLLVLGCLFVRRSTVSEDAQREKTEVMSIFIIVHVFMLSYLAVYVVEYSIVAGEYNEVLINAHSIIRLVSFCDFLLAPGLCLVLPLVRNVCCLPCALYTEYRRNNRQGSSIPLCESLNMANGKDA